MTNSTITLISPASPDQRSAHPWWMLATLLVGQLMGMIDVFVVNVAMPSISHDLGASGAELQLVVGGYTVAYAMFLITGARFGDLYGRKRMFLVGVSTFTVASLACGLAPTIGLLIAFRIVQGAVAALIVPQIMSILQTQFHGAQRARALSVYGVVLSTGAVLGLVLGGMIVAANVFGSSWRPVFLINVPLGIALLVAAPLLVPGDRPSGQRRLDRGGLLASVVSVSLIVLPLVFGNELGWPLWMFGCMLAGLVVGALFVRFEARVLARGGDPLLNVHVVRSRAFAPALGALWCGQIAYGGFLFIFTLYLQTNLGLGALGAAATWLPMAVAFGAAGFWWRALPRRIHAAVPAIGLVVCGIAYLCIAMAVGSDPLANPLLWIGLTLDGVGMGLAISPALALALARVRTDQASDASGLLTTTVQLGQLIGVAGVGALYFLLITTGSADAAASAAGTVAGTALSTTALVLATLAIVAAIPATLAARSAERG